MAIKHLQNNNLQNILVEFPVSNQRIFIYVQNGNQLLVTNDKCKHRGGPLHLCVKDSNGHRKCIWHNMQVPSKPQISNKIGVIFYKNNNKITLVCDNKEELWPVRFINH